MRSPCPNQSSYHIRLGYYRKRKAEIDTIDYGVEGIQKNPEQLRMSSDMYARAATLLPDDDSQKRVKSKPS